MIAVAGEALFDVYVAQDTADGFALDARLGGSPFNVAIGLARLQQVVTFIAAVGRGRLGDRLLTALTADGVDVACVQRVDGPTTLSVVALDAAGVPDYAFYGSQGADRQLTPTVLSELPENLQAIQLGSYATVVEPIATTLEMLVEQEHGRCVIAYDPNVRCNVEPSLDVWRSRLTWMASRTHLLKVSDEDLQLLYPGVPLVQLASQWRDAGVAVVVITRGDQGALAWCGDGHVTAEASALECVVDTVGAGDSFQAALLTWLAEHGALSIAGLRALDRPRLSAALCFASKAAAITCSRRGADLPRRSELV